MTRFADEQATCRPASSVAAWKRRGISRAMLTGPAFEATTYGFYRRAGAAVTSAQRILDVAAGLPEGALIAGWAAAYVHGVDTLDGHDDHTMALLPVPVLLQPGQRRRSTDAIAYRQSTRTARGAIVEDVPVTSILRTVVDLALLAPDLTEAVVCLDAMLAARRLTYAQLQRVMATKVSSRRGIRRARSAVALARVGVRSSWESRLRMFGELELGWSGLQPNRAVFDARGVLLGIPDLLDIEAGLAIEYDGANWRGARSAGHRDRAQHREDNAREERLERAGLVVVRVEKDDLFRFRTRLAERLRSGRADGLRRDRTRDGWTVDEPEGWYGLPA